MAQGQSSSTSRNSPALQYHQSRISSDSCDNVSRLFGYTNEELKLLIAPMGADGNEAVGSMGSDTPLAVLSERPQLLYNYFKQLFAQITNPPVDAIREELIMSTDTTIGPEANMLEPTPECARQIKLSSPILTNEQLDKLRHLGDPGLGGSGIEVQVDHFADAVRGK